ncbi:SDR family NAD(P)-dependent oxidoreductase [Cellulomonas hominis]
MRRDLGAGHVIAEVDLTGRRAVVTGGAGGLGRETARALASAGADVTIAAPDLAAAHRAAQQIAAETENPNVHVAQLDLADLASVAELVQLWSVPLHVLVDNAGVMATPERRTPQGHELQPATNHLGHFALTVGLHDALRAAGDARVVVVSSMGHVNGPVRFDDLDFTREPYDPWLAYAQSKSANVLFAVEAEKTVTLRPIWCGAEYPAASRAMVSRSSGRRLGSGIRPSQTRRALPHRPIRRGVRVSGRRLRRSV